MARGIRSVVLAVLCVSGGLAGLTAAHPAEGLSSTAGVQASSYQIDEAHDGVSTDPVGRAWTLAWKDHFTSGGTLSYPVIADGLVIVGVGLVPPKVIAYSQATGARVWGPDRLSGVVYRVGLTVDNGTLFALSSDATLYRIDLETGKVQWHVSASGNVPVSPGPPVAKGGNVYFAESFGTSEQSILVARSETTGKIVWQHQLPDWALGPLASSGSTIYVSAGCQYLGAFSLAGKLLWQHSVASCVAGNSYSPVVADGSVFDRDPIGNLQLNASNGHVIRSFSAAYAPAVYGGVSYATTSKGTLIATSVSTGARVFSISRNNNIVGPPLVVNGTIYVGSDPTSGPVLLEVSPSGSVLGTVALPFSAPTPDEFDAEITLEGMSEGAGAFVIPYVNNLAVLRPKT